MFEVSVAVQAVYARFARLSLQLRALPIDMRVEFTELFDFLALIKAIRERLDGLTHPSHASFRVVATLVWSSGQLGSGLQQRQMKTPTSTPGMLECFNLQQKIVEVVLAPGGVLDVESRGFIAPPDVTRFVWGLSVFPWQFPQVSTAKVAF